MNIRLIGIVEDGTTRRVGVPTNSAKTIAVVRGETTTIEVEIINPGDVRQSPGATDSVIMTISKRPGYGPTLTKTAVVTGNVATFSISPSDLKNFKVGKYVYDVWWTVLAGGRSNIIKMSTCDVLANVTVIP
jgi:hypothetical protein